MQTRKALTVCCIGTGQAHERLRCLPVVSATRQGRQVGSAEQRARQASVSNLCSPLLAQQDVGTLARPTPKAAEACFMG